MTKQEYNQILSSELAKRDAFWKAKMEQEIQKLKEEYEEKINNINKTHENSFDGQLGKLIANLVKQTVKEEVMEHLTIDIEKEFDYSSDDHDHKISLNWI